MQAKVPSSLSCKRLNSANSVTYYDETNMNGVARTIVDDIRNIGHTVITLVKKKLEYLSSLLCMKAGF